MNSHQSQWIRILLIEDDTAIGSAVREHATDDSHAVDWAKSLSAAQDYADVATYGLVLLDLHLPDGNGISYLREMRKRSDETPVIILTAHDQISDRIRDSTQVQTTIWLSRLISVRRGSKHRATLARPPGATRLGGAMRRDTLMTNTADSRAARPALRCLIGTA